MDTQVQTLTPFQYTPETTKLITELAKSEVRAWRALSKGDFQTFAKWASVWQTLNRTTLKPNENPWKDLSLLAQHKITHDTRLQQSLFDFDYNED
jgi:hypothetical protein